MVEILKEPHKVKARKNHICQGCGQTINAGDTVTSSSYSGEGSAWTFYECDDCSKHRNEKCFKCKDFDICMGEDYHIGLIKECKEEGWEG